MQYVLREDFEAAISKVFQKLDALEAKIKDKHPVKKPKPKPKK